MKQQYKADSKLEAQIAFILMKAGVTGPEVNACIYWAFGEGAWYVPISPDWINRWRKLHPQFAVKKSDKFVEWIYTVGFLYLQWKEWKLKREVMQ